MKDHIVIGAPLVGAHEEVLKNFAHVDIAKDPQGFTRDELLLRMPSATALLTMPTHRVDLELLSQAPKLKVVANHAVGLDNIDLEACEKAQITVTHTPNVLTEATADFAFALLLASARRLVEGDRTVRSGNFKGWNPTFMLGQRLQGKQLGIIGFGRIGQAFAKRCNAFGIHIRYTSRTRVSTLLEQSLGATFCSLDELIQNSDFISIHTPLTKDTFHLIDHSKFLRMKRNAIIINTSRGAVIDEEALAFALKNNVICGAGLDVYEREPMVNPELMSLDNVVLAPHLGSADKETRSEMASLAVNSIADVLHGRTPKHLAPKVKLER